MIDFKVKTGIRNGKETFTEVTLTEADLKQLCSDFFSSRGYADNKRWVDNRISQVEKLKNWKMPQNPIALVFPFYHKDVQQAERLMDWIAYLDRNNENTCILHCDKNTNYNKVLNRAKTCFKKVMVSVYDYKKLSWPSSNSYVFVKASDYMDANLPNTSWLWMETDGVPTKRMWLKRLDIEYKDGKMPFFGNVVDTKKSLHMNGLGVYPPDLRSWTKNAFLIEHNDNCQSWDMAMADEIKNFVCKGNDFIDHVWNVDENFKPCYGDGQIPSFSDNSQVDKILNPKTLIFHRNKDLTLIDFLKRKI